MDIHPHALRTLTRSLELITDELRADPEANRIFLETLTSRHNPEWALRMMNEAGVLGRFVPEFGHAVGLMQFNMYHHYTVDEHLIRAVGNVASIERGEHRKDNPLSTEIDQAHPVARACSIAPSCCTTSPKGLPGDHSSRGRRDRASPLSPAGPFASRHGGGGLAGEKSSGDERYRPAPRYLRSQDGARISSPRCRRRRCCALLLVLTVADIRAVGPGVWNGWKGQLLRELYHAAEQMMAGGDQAPARGARVDAAKAALAARLADVPEAERTHLLARHYDNYWLAFDADEQERHARLMLKADRAGELLTRWRPSPAISAT